MSSTPVPIKLTARVVTQGDTKFYYTSIPAVDLLDESRFMVDRWNNTSQRGYQREVNEPHTRHIAQFIRGNATPTTNVLPTPIVINVRGTLHVSAPDAHNIVQIEIPASEQGYIIDGQHRIAGARKVAEDDDHAILDTYEFGVVITNFNLQHEMIHFKNLNGTSNRPSKSLAQVIGHQLYEATGIAPITWSEQATNSAVALTIRLSTDSQSPFYGKISVGGIRKRSFHTTVQSAMVEALLPLFLNGRFSDPSLSPAITYQYVLDFWKAVALVWPEAMANPESSIIQRTVGVKPMTKILTKIFNNITVNPSPAQFLSILTDIRENLNLNDESWTTRPQAQLNSLRAGYSLNRGTTIIADFMWSGIDPKSYTGSKVAQ